MSSAPEISADPWDVLSAIRTALELYDSYGDVNDVLSASQVETLERLRPMVSDDE